MSDAVALNRLFPRPGAVSAAAAAAHLVGREVLILNMVAAVDGHTTVAGRSRGIKGGRGDRALFHALRAHSDAILVGTSTMAAEQYGAWIRDPAVQAMRDAAGLTAPPVGATLTRRGDVPWDIPLFATAARMIVYSGVEIAVPASVSADVEVVVVPDADPVAAVADLRARGVRSILGEGGPHLNGALLEHGLVDELALVLAPQLVGGDGPLTVIAGDREVDLDLRLLDAYEAADALLLRYRIAPRV